MMAHDLKLHRTVLTNREIAPRVRGRERGLVVVIFITASFTVAYDPPSKTLCLFFSASFSSSRPWVLGSRPRSSSFGPRSLGLTSRATFSTKILLLRL
ncbi:unnamed protein product [Linum trigynum]|uniref:Uncharacterized protein n=1 Tax=Linum trigynum TaxID=586398 RepID=A0AAV2EU13_9ROSI